MSNLSRIFKRHGITRKNTGHAAEQDRKDVKAARLAWFERQLDLDPDRLVFLDGTATNTKMARRYRRALPHRRPLRALEHHHRHGRPTRQRPDGHRPFDGLMTGAGFRDYVEETIVPALKSGDTAVLNNLPAHRVGGIRERIEAAGAAPLPAG